MIEEVFPFHLAPFPAPDVEHATRHDEVHVQMIVKPSGMRMQHSGGGKFGLQTGVIAAECAQGLDGCSKQQAVHIALMAPGQRIQFTGKGECQHEVRHG